MSNLYNLEPQPTAKVVLQTTSGDLTLELFAKQTPLASRNFLQHCLDGYYTNTIFHRLVPGFIIQGGDPTGTGSGGISAINDGEPFQDEFHSRLKYNRRGLLGMANEGKDSNGSQFFFTLGATPELQGRNTLFGRVEGDTIYNLMKMADAELVEGEGSERPLYPTRVTGAEILVNPFEDMVANVRTAAYEGSEEHAGKKQPKKRKKPAGKNVLSFGGDDGEDHVAPVIKKAKINPRFVAAEEASQPKSRRAEPASEPTAAPVPKARITAIDDDLKNHKTQSSAAASATPTALPSRDHDDEESSGDDSDEDPRPRISKLEKTNAEIAALKQSMKRSVEVKHIPEAKPKSALEAMIPATSTRGRKRGANGGAGDERGALDLFKAFKQRLEHIPDDSEDRALKPKPEIDAQREPGPSTQQKDVAAAQPASGDGEDEEAALCDLHFIPNCQSCKSWDADDGGDANDDEDNSAAWMSHKLSFAKDTLGKDLEWKRKMQEIEVIDPREKTREILGDRRKGKEKARGR